MNSTNRQEAERIISAFLDQNLSPTTDDWKCLVDKYPEYASAFVDAALVRRAGDAADASPEEYVLDEQLANRTVSKALSKAHQTPSWNLEAAKLKVASIQGAAARKEAAMKVGIGPYPGLLNGVLSGRTSAPMRLLRAISSMLEVPAVALDELFRRTFAASEVPAYKSTDAKPQIPAEPASWEDAVRALDLPSEETARLLKFAEKD